MSRRIERRVAGLLAVMVAVSFPASAEPLAAELDALLERPACQTPVTVQMPKAPLATLFGVLGRLACSLRFEVAPDIARESVSMELRDARLSTVLDLLAGNHNLEYAVEGDLVRVRRKGQAAAGPSASPEAKAAVVGAPADRRRVRFRCALGRPGRLVPAVSLHVGTTQSDTECTFLQSLEPGRPSLRLHGDGTVKPMKNGEGGVTVRLCPEKISEAGVDVVGEAVLRRVFDDGKRTVEERTLFRHSLRAGDKNVSLYKTPQGDFELMLLGYDVEGPAGTR